jgi:XamI restriction endonuclease
VNAARRYLEPPRWTDDQLEERRREAIADFIAARSAEGSARYQEIFATRLAEAEQLFAATEDLLLLGSGEALAGNPSLIEVARYLGAPPISGGDLNTLAEANVATRKRLDADLGRKTAEIILASLDPERFPWMFANPPRRPTDEERQLALRWTTGLKAAAETQTGRRGEASHRQEAAVSQLLLQLGFEQVAARPIELTGGLADGQFSREAPVMGVKCDVPLRLHDGRLLLIECKVSNEGTNSVKRLNREVGGKAREWNRQLGAVAVPAVVLGGVFRLINLQRAQEGGIAIFWERDLEPLAEFVEAAK